MWVLKYLIVFAIGLFIGLVWPEEEAEEEIVVEKKEPEVTFGGRSSPLFRAAAGARAPSGKEPSA